jgi:hypothetical protein
MRNGLLSLILVFLLITATTPNTIGVKQGDQATYRLHSFRSDAFPSRPLDTPYFDIEYEVNVLNTNGNNITFTYHSLNSTHFLDLDSEPITANLTNPYEVGNPQGYVHLFFYPANLEPNTTITRATYFDGRNVTVTDIRRMIVLGVEREVCRVVVNKFTNMTTNPTSSDQSFIYPIVQREEIFIDRATGLLVSWTFEFASAMYTNYNDVSWSRYVTQRWELEDTNAWSTPLWLRWDVLGSLDIVLLILVIVLTANLIRMRHHTQGSSST